MAIESATTSPSNSATGTRSCPLSSRIAERSAASWSTHVTARPCGPRRARRARRSWRRGCGGRAARASQARRARPSQEGLLHERGQLRVPAGAGWAPSPARASASHGPSRRRSSTTGTYGTRRDGARLGEALRAGRDPRGVARRRRPAAARPRARAAPAPLRGRGPRRARGRRRRAGPAPGPTSTVASLAPKEKTTRQSAPGAIRGRASTAHLATTATDGSRAHAEVVGRQRDVRGPRRHGDAPDPAEPVRNHPRRRRRSRRKQDAEIGQGVSGRGGRGRRRRSSSART